MNISEIPPSSSNVAVPVGISLGVLSLLVIIGVGLWWCCKNRRRTIRGGTTTATTTTTNEGNLTPVENHDDQTTNEADEENLLGLNVPEVATDLNKDSSQQFSALLNNSQ